MRQSELFTRTLREDPAGEESVNAKLLIRAGYIDKLMAGVYTLLPLGVRTYRKIESIIREEMNGIGGQEIVMPSMNPKENWQQTGRYDTLDVLFRFTSFYSKNEIVLAPTHEEVVSPLMKPFLLSYKDLPVKVFQIQNKFRDEKRAKGGVLRTREFVMKDLYSFHADETDLDNYYEIVKNTYSRIFSRVGIGHITHITYASGGSFSKYSHEFQTVAPAGEDVIYICQKCSVAINKEIYVEQNSCPECGNTELVEKNAIEVGNIFKLKTKFSEPFKLVYKDKEGAEKPVVMGCYGIGLQRLMGTIVEALHDEKGIVWPESVAPFKAHLIELPGAQGASELYEKLMAANAEVLWDDRIDVGAGAKFADSDLIGIPYRLVVSAKTNDKVEVKRRTEQESTLMDVEEVINLLVNT
mgnify:CR=1 FL=1